MGLGCCSSFPRLNDQALRQADDRSTSPNRNQRWGEKNVHADDRKQGKLHTSSAGELAGTGDDELAARLTAPLAQVQPASMEATARSPGDLADSWILALLTLSQPRADLRTTPAVLRGLDQKAPWRGSAWLW
jgi:hypothetical protein